jgi:hypothetical protein
VTPGTALHGRLSVEIWDNRSGRMDLPFDLAVQLNEQIFCSALFTADSVKTKLLLSGEGASRDRAIAKQLSATACPTSPHHNTSSALAMVTTATPTPTKIPELSSRLNRHAPPSDALEAVGARPRRTQRRPTKQASYELCNHAKAYLEGGQCM